MTDFLLRDLDPVVLDRLRRRAEENGRSLQAEIKATLSSSVKMTWDEFFELSRRLRAETEGRSTISSVELLREDRDR